MLLVLLGLMASAGVASVVIDHYDDDEANSAETTTEVDDAQAQAGTSRADMEVSGGSDDTDGSEEIGETSEPATEEVAEQISAPEDEGPVATEVDAGAEGGGTETAADEAPDPVVEDSPAQAETSGETVDFERLVAAEIAGEGLALGDGDDFVDATPPGGRYSDLHVDIDLDLGGGDDTVVGPFFGSNLSGGAGDDLFEVEETGGEVLSIDGGAGNDTIDVRTSSNVILEGGAGDDVIHAGGASSTGDGYVTRVDGGAGNDTLHFYADNDGGFNPAGAINGSAGTDHFVVDVNDQVRGLNSGGPTAAPSDGPAGDEPAPARSSVVVLGDFDPTMETLELHIGSPNVDYEATSVHIEEDGVVVTYESDIYRSMEKLIVCNTEGLTPEQITLVGVDPSILVGAPASSVVCV
ncbi:hypothetical protein [Shimia sp.]|jgi:hypothetical protein|uniref:hypothetical protein n=1 Tax=unclassified Shimia TaxID=2630038 RepID=UPI0025F1BA11|nr:hypothetical protein [Shimia sp.]MCH2067425.1 hypothetical protein [Shimia sp.]